MIEVQCNLDIEFSNNLRFSGLNLSNFFICILVVFESPIHDLLGTQSFSKAYTWKSDCDLILKSWAVKVDVNFNLPSQMKYLMPVNKDQISENDHGPVSDLSSVTKL